MAAVNFSFKQCLFLLQFQNLGILLLPEHSFIHSNFSNPNYFELYGF